MATRATQALVMPDGNRYEFFGRTYYGVCSTTASTQAKQVTITGFTSTSLNEGVRIVVRFTNSQTYNGTPTLNVSSTGAKNIQYIAGSNAGQYEWEAGEIIGFIYYNNAWVIENGNHAEPSYWGKITLNNIIGTVSGAGFLTLGDLPIYDGTVV